MVRNLRHIHLRALGKERLYKPKGRGRGKAASAVLDRQGHAISLLKALDSLPDIGAEGLPGVYLEVQGRPGEPLNTKSLDSSGLELLSTKSVSDLAGTHTSATIFATADGVSNLRKKVEQFRTEENPPREKNGEIIPGGPRNGALVNSVASIAEASLRALWRSPQSRFPDGGAATGWEIWIEPDALNHFVGGAAAYGVAIGSDRLEFPEDIVLVCWATRDALALAVRRLGGVRALASVSVTADDFDSMDVLDQVQWVTELVARTTFPASAEPGYVTVMDTGVSRAHPLIQPVLAAADRHAANVAWGIDDVRGHGTSMAGLVLYGDLTGPVQQGNPVTVYNRLESVKLLPDVQQNPHHLLGTVTRNGVDTVEGVAERRRTFLLANTTGEDTPHDGAPTSWSTEIDQLAAGVSGNMPTRRLIVISAGNTDNSTFGPGNYLDRCDHADNEIESPAQAWNAISVGAYTEKLILPIEENLVPVAPFGDLSPSSRTASWQTHWPIKPDVVLEGGNWAAPPPMRHGWLSLLSTHKDYPQRSFTFSHDTSAATALAAKALTELWSEYPQLWPETVRGLFVSSARWTDQMRSHLPPNPNKGAYAPLFRRYGYGVPDLARARASASNATTVIVEDEITPYGLSDKGEAAHNEMRFFELPWPVDALRKLGNAEITLRVTLSSFVEPNPSEAARGSRYRYASHNLRFKLNRAGEKAEQFMSRISKLAEQVEVENVEGDGWDFGSDRRDVGSVHIDQLKCKASDLARRNLLIVHPVSGWWRNKALLKGELPSVRYALILEIDAGGIEVDLHTEIRTAVEARIAAGLALSV